MAKDKLPTLPKPFGDEVPRDQWRRVFLLARKNSPLVNLFNGHDDQTSELLSFMMESSGGLDLVLDEFPPSFADRGRNPLVLVRLQYFEAGLHHRVSFHASMKARVRFEESPACLLSVIPPVRRVSNLYVAYPSEEKPLFLEIPIAGAPPDVRVVEFSMGHLKAFLPKVHRLLPETKYIQDMRLQFVDLGDAVVSGKARRTGEQEFTIDLDPLPAEAHSLSEAYLANRFSEEVNASAEEATSATADETKAEKGTSEAEAVGRAKPRQIHGKTRDHALLILEDARLRGRLVAILKKLGFEVDARDSYEDIRAINSVDQYNLILLDSQQGDVHAVDLLRALIRDDYILPTRFVLVGQRLAEARESDWSALGQGLFLRSALPDQWLKTKLERWLESLRTTTAPQAGNVPQVLVVDDDPDMRESIGSLLAVHGFRILTADNGIEAIRSVRNLKPNAVLLDLEMPGRSGLEVLRTLRAFKLFRHLPIIIVSGRRDPDALQEAIRLGITDYVVKPFDDLSLVERLRSALYSPEQSSPGTSH